MIGDKTQLIKYLLDQPEGQYEVKPYKPKRSLTANSYYWTLLTELAGAMRISREECHDIMLKRYGQYLTDEEGNIVAVLTDPRTDIRKIPGHYDYYDTVNGALRYKVLRGSHTYNTKEFSRLVDGLVSECKEADIETLTPDELERLRGYTKA